MGKYDDPQAERAQMDKLLTIHLLAIHERWIAMVQQRIDGYYAGQRAMLPIDELMQLEANERCVAELKKKLEATH